MIIQFTARENRVNPTFSSLMLKPQRVCSANISHFYKASQKINSIKNVCEDIFASIKIDENILAKANSLLEKAKLTDSSITILNENDVAIKFSQNILENKKIFIMEFIEQEQPKASLILDQFGGLIKSNEQQKLEYYTTDEIDAESLEKIAKSFFELSDEPLFNLRMFIRKNCEVKPNVSISIQKEEVPDLVKPVNKEEVKADELLSYMEQKRDLLKKLPISQRAHNYSYREVIKHNQKIETDLKNKGLYQEEEVEALGVFNDSKRSSKFKQLRRNKKANKTSTSSVLKEEKVQTNAEKKEKSVELKTSVEEFAISKKEKRPKKTKKIKKEKKINKERKTPVKIFKEKVVELLPKRKPGRPKKVVDPSIEAIKPKKGKGIRVKENILPAGIVDSSIQEQLKDIFGLNSFIEKTIKSVTSQTRGIIYNAYGRINAKKNGFQLDNVDIKFLRRKTWDESRAINIVNKETNQAVNIFESGKILSNHIDLKNLIRTDNKQFLTQEEINNPTQAEEVKSLLSCAIKKMEEYKTYLERKGWRSVERRLASTNEGQVDTQVLQRLRDVTEKYVNLKSRLSHMNSGKACCIKKDYGIVSIKTPRLEFVNAFNDGYNLVISKLTSKYGNLTLVCRYDGGKILEDVFVISEDGKFVKNYNKNIGLTSVINHKCDKVKYLNDDYIEKEQLSAKLDNILGLIETKIADCEKFIDNYNYVKK